MPLVRFTGISIEDFKNVARGEVGFLNRRVPGGPSILALYGQNGSGKTALIDCLKIFKHLFMNEPIPSKYADCIMEGSESARVTYSLEVEFSGGRLFEARYCVEFAEQAGAPADRFYSESDAAVDAEPQRVRVLSETLSYKEAGVGRMKVAFTTSGTDTFKPKKSGGKAISKIEEGRLAEGRAEMFYNQGLSCISGFTDWASDAETAIMDALAAGTWPDVDWGYDMCGVFSSLSWFASSSLFIADTAQAESIEEGSLSMFYDKRRAPEGAIDVIAGDWGAIELPTSIRQAEEFPTTLLDAVEPTVESVNIVLGKLVPGMRLVLHRADGQERGGMQMAYLGSSRGTYEIDLANESRGIQKLVSVAWLLVGVYCYRGFTAVIDELDAGIFEFLLGQVLDIIQDEGEGQLIFTSHNLRPVERLDKGYVAFTTQNPQNRYIRLKNIKTGHNRRDFYFSAIQQGGQDECIYDFTTDGELSQAFIKAGSPHGD